MRNKAVKNSPAIILLVEDNRAHAELVRRCFEDHPIANSVYHISDGEAALDYLLRRGKYADPKQSPRPNLVLLDLRLPKVDGLAVLKEARTSGKLRHVPIVILTTSEADGDMAKAYELRASSYLVKPVDFEKFSRLMRELGLYWLGWNEMP